MLDPVGWGRRIHRLHLRRGENFPDKFPEYDIKLSDGDAPLMIELWRMQSTRLLPLFLGPLWPGMVATNRTLYMGQIELFEI